MLKDDYPKQKIDSADISVVIQGLLYRDHASGDLAARAISSIREYLPRAEIILSTWAHQSVEGLEADQVIISNEPPSLIDQNGNINNVLRQLVSTRNGIEKATRPYILKFRADHFLTSDAITHIQEYNEAVPACDRLFISPITVTNLFIRNPLHVPMLFHISDLVQFGRKDDLQNFWSVPLPEKKDLYFAQTPRMRIVGHFVGFTSLRQVPEQTLMLAFLKERGHDISLAYTCYTTYALFKWWEKILTDNFHVIDWQRSGIHFPDRFHQSFYCKHANYTEYDLEIVRQQLERPTYCLRYIALLINKYVTCWFKLSYLSSVASMILFSIAPGFAKRLRAFYRRKVKGV